MINRGESGDGDGDDTFDGSDRDEGVRGEEGEDNDDDDESFIEIDTEEVFELLAKGKSYATFEGTHRT